MTSMSRRAVLKAAAATTIAAVMTEPLHRFAGAAETTAPSVDPRALTLWYRKPANGWTDALPLGNGRLGAMVFGGVDQERLQLNEGTLWGGGPYDPSNPDSLAALPEVRQLMFDGKYAEAQRLIGAKMMGRPIHQMPYQTVGDLLLNFGTVAPASPVSNYLRELDLDTAIARVRFTRDGVTFTREMWASPIDQVIVVQLKADQPGKIAFALQMKTPMKAAVTLQGRDTLLLDGINGPADNIEPALKFQARVRVSAIGGTVTPGDGQIVVSGADSALLIVSAATSYRSYADVSGNPAALTAATITAAARRSVEEMRDAHITEHRRLFRRVSIDLGRTPSAALTTDERVRNSAKNPDPDLAALYFQFGRYLLIGSSRAGGQPANLQGIWNESLKPPWGSKYTININTEMNYWPAESTNLPECVEPLIVMIQDLSISGARTARVQYGASGWVCHHNTDLWRASAPIDGPNYGMWPSGGAWLCKHLWDRYEYGGDRNYLARVYPLMKGAAQFFLDTLVEEPTRKWLVTCPSMSPEHEHRKGVMVCAGPAMDMQIIRDLFNNTMRAADVLGIDSSLRAKLSSVRDRLAPNQIGKAGQLQEWMDDWDMEAPDLHHRHVSHLYGLFPSDQIDPRTTPELAAAARKTLETRGDEATGWGLGWRLNLWARLLDGDHAHQILARMLRPDRTYANLFDAHPPFQIDGNFGGSSGITEMLMQSHGGEIHLLPALPKAWPSGRVSGLCARGGFGVDLSWRDGKLEQALIRSTGVAPACTVRYGQQTVKRTLKSGESIRLNAELRASVG